MSGTDVGAVILFQNSESCAAFSDQLTIGKILAEMVISAPIFLLHSALESQRGEHESC
jgi:hypothetical protein